MANEIIVMAGVRISDYFLPVLLHGLGYII